MAKSEEQEPLPLLDMSQIPDDLMFCQFWLLPLVSENTAVAMDELEGTHDVSNG